MVFFLGWAVVLLVVLAPTVAVAQTWTADNGNGTYTNPLFFDEFSDPDLIRVGDDFYLTGTTMHAMPGLPVLHSTDLVNWELVSYALDRLDLGPEYRLEGGRDLRTGDLGAELPLPRRHLPHLHATSTGRRRSTSRPPTHAGRGRARP